MTLLDLMEAPQKLSRTAQLAAYFKAHAGVWLNALQLEFAGRQAWRTRVAECRKAPYNMRIDNRQYKRGDLTISEYRFIPRSDDAQS